MPAGLSARIHSTDLLANLPPGAFQVGTHPRPILHNNILVGNRSYYFDGIDNPIGELIAVDGPQSVVSPQPDQQDHYNLGVVLGLGNERLEAEHNVLMNTSGFSSTNIAIPVEYNARPPDNLFVKPQVNAMTVAGSLPAGLVLTITVKALAPEDYDYRLKDGTAVHAGKGVLTRPWEVRVSAKNSRAVPSRGDRNSSELRRDQDRAETPEDNDQNSRRN